MTPKKILCLILATAALIQAAYAVTVTGTIRNRAGDLRKAKVVFSPYEGQTTDGTYIQTGAPIVTRSARDGTLSLTLMPGSYTVLVDDEYPTFSIVVPDVASVNIASITTNLSAPTDYVSPYAITTWRTNHNVFKAAAEFWAGTNQAELVYSTNGSTALVSKAWAFDAYTAESIWIQFALPDDWAGNGYLKVKVLASATGDSSGIIVWEIKASAMGNGDALGSGFSTSYFATNTITGADKMLSTPARLIGIGGTPVLGDILSFKFQYSPSRGSASEDVLLHGVQFQYSKLQTQPALW